MAYCVQWELKIKIAHDMALDKRGKDYIVLTPEDTAIVLGFFIGRCVTSLPNYQLTCMNMLGVSLGERNLLAAARQCL